MSAVNIHYKYIKQKYILAQAPHSAVHCKKKEDENINIYPETLSSRDARPLKQRKVSSDRTTVT
jgi:hypothetical protein